MNFGGFSDKLSRGKSAVKVHEFDRLMRLNSELSLQFDSIHILFVGFSSTVTVFLPAGATRVHVVTAETDERN